MKLLNPIRAYSSISEASNRIKQDELSEAQAFINTARTHLKGHGLLNIMSLIDQAQEQLQICTNIYGEVTCNNPDYIEAKHLTCEVLQAVAKAIEGVDIIIDHAASNHEVAIC